MEISHVYIPEEIIAKIFEYIPLPTSSSVCRLFHSIWKDVWQRDVEKIAKEHNISSDKAEIVLMILRNRNPLVKWSTTDYLHVIPTCIHVILSISVIIHIIYLML